MNIIVSGASQGIGFETALNFAKKGHKVLAISRNRVKLDLLKSESSNIITLEYDLIKEGLKEEIVERFENKKVQVLINNAGQLINKPFLETTLENFRSQFDSNVLTTVNLIQASENLLERNSHIVNISSMGGFQGSSKFNGLSAYSSTKSLRQ